MVKYLIFLFLFHFFLIGCETVPVIKKFNPVSDIIYINAVQKNLNLQGNLEGPHSQKVKKQVEKWLNNNIKTNGYKGVLDIKLLSIKSSEIIIESGVKIEMSLKLNFIIENEALTKKRSKTIKVNEFGELTGNFSLNDKDIEIQNIIKRLLQRLGNTVFLEIN